MALEMILFDLDGTLLPMDQDRFIQLYFQSLAAHLSPYGYDAKGLFAAVQAGIGAMVQNDGAMINEDAFWQAFRRTSGRDGRADLPLFDAYYQQHFVFAKGGCGYDPQAAECIAWLKQKGLRLALATNPFFPATATRQRIQWAGLNPEDFEIITTFENSRFCKPNPQYYRQLAQDLRIAPERCLMVGNDAWEDLIAEQTGMKVFLLIKGLLNKPGIDITPYPQGDFEDLKHYILSLLGE